MKVNDSQLVGGPQDGAKVTIGGTKPVPDVIYVGPKWLGDGYAAWAREGPSKSKPARYVRRDGKHYFQPNVCDACNMKECCCDDSPQHLYGIHPND